ncbi:class I tRNA ligase family protein [Streptomyces sp. NPDC059456]|uniref:class I tRNA ligase family protein n=1 Tax=Streptomyces sp. NPDC059456 TaxID=3346838 RepID=UPI00368B8B01
MQQLTLQGEEFFLTPVCLVPNGRAHLGHIAGPLLKMDVLRRHIVRGGGKATMISLSDSHESHVLVRAHQDGVAPEDVANLNHHLIGQDLAALDIAYDDLINPLDGQWAAVYEAVNREFLAGIVESGSAAIRSEPMPVLRSEDAGAHAGSMRPRVGEAIVSGWLKGKCPDCAQPLVGFFCESCGGHFSPAEMIEPSTAHFSGALEFEDLRSLYLELRGGPDRLMAHLREICRRPDFLAIAHRYLQSHGAAIRLTVPSPWGIPWESDGLAPGQVIFSYSALLIGCHLVAGERYKELTGSALNPFEKGSRIRTVISFGVDNSVPFMVGAVGCALGQDRYKPVDSLLVNYFYDLEGSKFSTSRGHVIWGGDLVTLGGAEPDLARAYLCLRGPEYARAAFQVEEFLRFHNETGTRASTALQAAADRLFGHRATAPDPGVLGRLERALTHQSAVLDPDTFDLAGAWTAVDRWIATAGALTATAGTAAAWLLGFSVLAAPVMPSLAQRVWELVGQPGTPTIAALADGVEAVTLTGEVPRLRSLSRGEFNACLPVALRK